MTIRNAAQSRRNKARGRRAERDVADLLAQHFQFADRKRQKGSQDQGDVGGVPDLTIEVKDLASFNLAKMVDEAMVEKENAGTRWCVAVQRRPKRNIREAYAVQPLEMFIEMYARLQELEERERQRQQDGQPGAVPEA